METYTYAFELRKWPRSRNRRCSYCKRLIAAGSGAKYCRTCSHALLGRIQVAMTASADPVLPNDGSSSTTGHFAEIAYMVRTAHGRAMLAPFLLRQHEARLAAGQAISRPIAEKRA